MANERMFLLHVPSGYSVYLGKRMGWGWYDADESTGPRIQRLFEMVETQQAEGEQDAFAIAFENDIDWQKIVR